MHAVSDGGTRPYRAHFRDPSFNNLQAVSVMCEGGQVADVVVAVSRLIAGSNAITEIEINPVRVAASGALAVDAALFGAAVPWLLLSWQARRRTTALRELWPDAVDHARSAIRAFSAATAQGRRMVAISPWAPKR